MIGHFILNLIKFNLFASSIFYKISLIKSLNGIIDDEFSRVSQFPQS
jgi:hypothetical protein